MIEEIRRVLERYTRTVVDTDGIYIAGIYSEDIERITYDIVDVVVRARREEEDD
jgi:hypothetical protein